MISNRILLIGALNQFKPPNGGEEYKNQLLYSQLSHYFTTKVIDTHLWKRRPLLLIALVHSLFFKNWDNIIISASSRSVYRLLIIIQFFPNISKKITYFVIGGYLPSAVESGTFRLSPYQNLKSIVVEGRMLKNKLEQSGVKGRIYVIPNFKRFPKDIKPATVRGESVNFLFISRIHPDKGINEIIEADNILNDWGIKDYTITFYGPIENDYYNIFQSLLSNNMIYGGVLDIMNDNINAYKTLSSFDIMLFPTYWKGEGFPGALVDAFIAGLPIIATDWNMNKEVIKHGIDGLLIAHKNAYELATAMKILIENKTLRIAMADESSKRAKDYHIDNIWPDIVEILQNS